jgi:hypothetical protein
MKCPSGVKNCIGFASVLLLLSLGLMLPAFGASFSVTVTPSLANTNGVSQMVFNFTVSDADAAKGITQVVIILPSGFQFVTGSDNTSIAAGLYNFTNETSNTRLVWKNATAANIIASLASEYFWFSSSVPSTSGSYSFTVETTDSNNTVNSTSVNLVIDNAAPVVTLNSPNAANLSSSSVTFKFNATDNVASSMNCSLYVDGVQKGFNASTLNGVETSFLVSGLAGGQHAWNVNCTDGISNVGASASGSFGLYPDVIVSYLQWSPQGDPHLNATSNITVTARVKNVGDFGVTDARKFNVTLKLDGVVKGYATLNTTLTAGQEVQVFTSSVLQNIGLGNHTILVEVVNQDENGTFVLNEANATNNNNQTAVFAGYLISIEPIAPYNVLDTQINENDTLKFRVTVRYSNGDSVSGLVNSSFTITDNSHNPVEKTIGANIISFDDSEGSGVYKFNVTASDVINGRPEHGWHNITVIAKRSVNDVVILEGTGTSAYMLYAPDVALSMNPPGDIDISESQGFTITLTNNGNLNASGVSAKLFKVSGAGSVTWAKGPVNSDASGTTTFCSDKNVSVGEAVACKNSGNDNPEMKGKTAGEYRMGAWLNYTMNARNYYYYVETVTTVINTSASQDAGSGGQTTPTLGGDGATCDSSKDCKSGYWCNNGVCTDRKSVV